MLRSESIGKQTRLAPGAGAWGPVVQKRDRGEGDQDKGRKPCIQALVRVLVALTATLRMDGRGLGGVAGSPLLESPM